MGKAAALPYRINPWRGGAAAHPNSDPKRGTETSGGIVRLRTVVTDEDAAVAAITIQRAAELPDVRWSCNPTRRLRIEVSKLLQREIFFFRQKLNAHGCSHVHGGSFRASLFPR